MTHPRLLTMILCCIGVVSAPLYATADETGFASMHSWTKVGRKTCMTDHTHYGSSTGHRTERAAMRAAIKDWQEFTAGEYGLDWAYFHRAHARLKSCNRAPGGWECSIEGRPCRNR